MKEPDVQLDHARYKRRGYAEAIYCEGKTLDQLSRIAGEIAEDPEYVTLFTRCDPTMAGEIRSKLPEARYDEASHLLAWPPDIPPPTGHRVVVVTAGTSDLPVAREALLTARYLGREARLVVDVGIAGVHRVLAQVDLLRSARAVVCVAGMDGALPGLIAGLISAPVVAVPTSVGYGAAFDGLAPLLTMLNACAPGVAVVNIDNGYGAGHLAAQITAP